MNPLTQGELELARLIIETLGLEDVRVEEIQPEAPLYGDQGLGLDSIDILEVSLAVSKRFGVRLRADDADNVKIFASLRALSRHIEANRPQ